MTDSNAQGGDPGAVDPSVGAPEARAFLEASVVTPAGWQELVAEALSVEGCTGVAFGPRSLATPELPVGTELVRAFYPAAAEGAGGETVHRGTRLEPELRARLAALAAAVGGADGGALDRLALELRALPPEDWATTWRKVWRPLRVGRLCVVPRDWDRPPRPGDVRLELEPGAAFGTGRHATTRRALAALGERLRPGQRVVDAGCGSGILAVAACLLGAERATGFDLDASAVAHARELASANGVAARASFVRLDLERPQAAELAALGPPADGLLANLYGDLVRAHAGTLAGLVRPGGWFVVTGCRSEARAEVGAALGAAGLAVEEVRSRGRWDAFTGTRRAPSEPAG